MAVPKAVEELVRLTTYARCAGCASKMGPGELSIALSPLPPQVDSRLLVGRETYDDAAIFALTDDIALVQTLDFFAPIVDDPYTFGRVAATNALSDVFAMGGEPLTAMNIVAYPTGKLELSVLSDILSGGHDAVHAAGAVLVGGHTVTDDELKYGLSVTGRANPRHFLTNAAARAGDVLVLTKPLGTGILATAAKQGRLSRTELEGMVRSMTTLNASASRAALAAGARCATDITGFGLLGHASHVARASQVTLELEVARVPELPGTRAAWRAGATTGGGERNAEYLAHRVAWGTTTVEDRALLVDPQTSGGLLVALRPEAVARYQDEVEGAVKIGEVLPRGATDIILV